QQTLDDARSAADAAQASLEAAAAREELARTRLSKADIRAPMAGVIASRTVNPGDFIENMGSPRPMFTIVDNQRLELTVSIPSSAIASVVVGQPLTFTVDAIPGRVFEGKVSYINPAVDQASRTLKVIAAVDNRDGALKSGLVARGEIVTSRRADVLRVARGALVTWDPTARSGVVYVVENGRAKKRDVATGASTAEAIEIRGGLSAGETVVTRGAFDVKDGDRVTVVNASKKA
ncbi:MAG: efflux RND transporter periplasmic adaptor subunit, partial [Thermoanaerobaculia bacterium]